MTTCDLKRLQDAATHARIVRDYHDLEVSRLERELAGQREAQRAAGEAYAELDARLRAETAPKLVNP